MEHSALPNQLIVEEAAVADSSVVTIHPRKAEELGLMDGDNVRLKGKRDSETLCVLRESDQVSYAHTWAPRGLKCCCSPHRPITEQVPVGSVQLSVVSRSNLRIELGDTVKLYCCDDVKHGTTVKLLPYSDKMMGLSSEELKTLLDPAKLV